MVLSTAAVAAISIVEGRRSDRIDEFAGPSPGLPGLRMGPFLGLEGMWTMPSSTDASAARSIGLSPGNILGAVCGAAVAKAEAEAEAEAKAEAAEDAAAGGKMEAEAEAAAGAKAEAEAFPANATTPSSSLHPLSSSNILLSSNAESSAEGDGVSAYPPVATLAGVDDDIGEAAKSPGKDKAGAACPPSANGSGCFRAWRVGRVGRVGVREGAGEVWSEDVRWENGGMERMARMEKMERMEGRGGGKEDRVRRVEPGEHVGGKLADGRRWICTHCRLSGGQALEAGP